VLLLHKPTGMPSLHCKVLQKAGFPLWCCKSLM
jgi:hypothetical protein